MGSHVVRALIASLSYVRWFLPKSRVGHVNGAMRLEAGSVVAMRCYFRRVTSMFCNHSSSLRLCSVDSI